MWEVFDAKEWRETNSRELERDSYDPVLGYSGKEINDRVLGVKDPEKAVLRQNLAHGTHPYFIEVKDLGVFYPPSRVRKGGAPFLWIAHIVEITAAPTKTTLRPAVGTGEGLTPWRAFKAAKRLLEPWFW